VFDYLKMEEVVLCLNPNVNVEKLEVEDEMTLFDITVIHQENDGTETSKRVVVPLHTQWSEILTQATSLTSAEIACAYITPVNGSGNVLEPYISFQEYSQLEDTTTFSIIVRVPTQDEQYVHENLRRAEEEFYDSESALNEAKKNLKERMEVAERSLSQEKRNVEFFEKKYSHARARMECAHNQVDDLREKKRSKK